MTAYRWCILGVAAWVLIAGSPQWADSESGGESWYLQVDEGVELFIHEIGTGEPVVVLHGGPGADHSPLHAIATGLTDRYRFVFYDQRGSLRSRASRDQISIEAHVRDLNAIRIALGLDSANLVSHSAGTTLAYNYLAAHPERVAKLVMVGAVYPVNGDPGREIFDEEDRTLFRRKQQEVDEFNDRPAVHEAIRAAGLEEPRTARERGRLAVLRQFAADSFRVELWRQHVPLRVNWEAAQATQESIDWNYNHLGLLSAHRYPVTVINGEFDLVIGSLGSPIWKKLVARHAPAVAVVVLSDAGHAPWIDAPEAFRNALLSGLRSDR